MYLSRQNMPPRNGQRKKYASTSIQGAQCSRRTLQQPRKCILQLRRPKMRGFWTRKHLLLGFPVWLSAKQRTLIPGRFYQSLQHYLMSLIFAQIYIFHVNALSLLGYFLTARACPSSCVTQSSCIYIKHTSTKHRRMFTAKLLVH